VTTEICEVRRIKVSFQDAKMGKHILKLCALCSRDYNSRRSFRYKNFITERDEVIIHNYRRLGMFRDTVLPFGLDIL